MPLIHSKSNKALQENMRTLHSEIGKSPHVQSRAQAVAIALETQRRAGRGKQAGGGVSDPDVQKILDDARFRNLIAHYMARKPVMPSGKAGGGGLSGTTVAPWYERQASRRMAAGMLHSPVPGRTDKLPLNVGSGSYVLPADHVAALGQGNSTAGASVLKQLFNRATGMKGFNRFRMQGRHGMFAKGGMAKHDGKEVPIVAAGGEYILQPHEVAWVGGGDIDKGHKILDKWVLQTRQKHVKTLRNLKPPKK